MSLNQKIGTFIELSKDSGVPLLLVSNPGYGKTTMIQNYADVNGYHLETLIGSRFSPEEIMGYMVNDGGESLNHKNPEWFQRIWQNEKNGKHSILFCDEISTCSEATLGSLLSLIFDREISCAKKLPEKTVIVAAANYAKNLSAAFNILSPVLNRFCIINVTESLKNLDVISEFTSEIKDFEPLAPAAKIDDKKFDTEFSNILKNIVISYSDKDSGNGYLDFQNTDFEGIYSDNEGFLRNFMTGRSISYFKRLVKAMVQRGIKDTYYMSTAAYGLIGLGTNNFSNKNQVIRFNKVICESMNALFKINKEEKALSNDLTSAVEDFITRNDKELVVKDADKELDNIAKLADKEWLRNDSLKFVSNFELVSLVTHKNSNKKLTNVMMKWFPTYCEYTKQNPSSSNFLKITGISLSTFVFKSWKWVDKDIVLKYDEGLYIKASNPDNLLDEKLTDDFISPLENF